MLNQFDAMQFYTYHVVDGQVFMILSYEAVYKISCCGDLVKYAWKETTLSNALKATKGFLKYNKRYLLATDSNGAHHHEE